MKIIYAPKIKKENTAFIKGNLYMSTSSELVGSLAPSIYLFSCGSLIGLDGKSQYTTGSERQKPSTFIDVTEDYILIASSLLAKHQLG